MITREVNREDSNLAIIKHIYPATGEFVCRIQLIENDVVIQENDNIVFPADYFTLTDEEKEELGYMKFERADYTDFEELEDVGD